MSTYSVKANGLNLLYNFLGECIYGEKFTILKDNKPTYEVTTSTLGDWCNCPAGRHRGDCKHLQMVDKYIEEIKNARNKTI
jgi:hypothetical protein